MSYNLCRFPAYYCLFCIISAVSILTASASFLPGNPLNPAKSRTDNYLIQPNLTIPDTKRLFDERENGTVSEYSRKPLLINRLAKFREVGRERIKGLQENVLDRLQSLRHGDKQQVGEKVYKLDLEVPIMNHHQIDHNNNNKEEIKEDEKNGDTFLLNNRPINELIKFDETLENEESRRRWRTNGGQPIDEGHRFFEAAPDMTAMKLNRKSRGINNDFHMRLFDNFDGMTGPEVPSHAIALPQMAQSSDQVVAHQEPMFSSQTPAPMSIVAGPVNTEPIESDTVWRTNMGGDNFAYGKRSPKRQPSAVPTRTHNSAELQPDNRFPTNFDDRKLNGNLHEPAIGLNQKQGLKTAESYEHEYSEHADEQPKCADEDSYEMEHKEEKKAKKLILEKEHHHHHHHHHHHEAKHKHKEKGKEHKKYHSQPVHLEIRIEGKSKHKSKSKGKDKGKDKEKAKGKGGDKVYIKFAQGHVKHEGEMHEHGHEEGGKMEEGSRLEEGPIEDKKSLIGGEEQDGANGDSGEGNSKGANLAAVSAADEGQGGGEQEEKREEAKEQAGKGSLAASSRRQMGHTIDTSQVPNSYFDIHDDSHESEEKREEVQVEEKHQEHGGKEEKAVVAEKEEPKKEEPKKRKKEEKIKKEKKVRKEEKKKEEHVEEKQEQPVVEEKHKEEEKKKEVRKEEEKPVVEEKHKEEEKKEEKHKEKKKSKHHHIELHEHNHFEHHEHINLHKQPMEEVHEGVELGGHGHHEQNEHVEPVDLGHHQHHHLEPIPIKEHWIVPDMIEKPKSHQHPHGAFIIEDHSELEKHGMGHPIQVGYKVEVANHPHGIGLNPSGHYPLMGAYSTHTTTHVNKNNATTPTDGTTKEPATAEETRGPK